MAVVATPTGFLAPNPRFQMRDKTGAPARNGELFTYIAGTTTPKATYMDPELQIPNTNPVVMNMAGEALIYWADDSLYRLLAYQEDGQELYDQDNYPIVGGSDTPIENIANLNSLARNPQFTFWTNTIEYPPIFSNAQTSVNNMDFLADDWLFSKTDADSVINFSQGTFAPGDAEVPGYATNYISCECSSVGAGTETNLQIYQRYEGAESLNATSVTILFSARVRNATSALLVPHLYQNFGTGGSPSITLDNFEGAETLTQAWQNFRQTIPLQNITGKTLGTDGNSALELSFQYPSNSTFGIIDITAVQLTEGQNTIGFIYQSQNDQQIRLYRNTSQQWYTSDHKMTLRNTADDGWLLCDDGTIGSTSSGATTAGMLTKALFGYLWALSPLYVPIYNSDGTAGTRSGTANADFNLNKRIAITKTLGRVLAGQNAGSVGVSKIFTASSSSGLLLTFDTIGGIVYTGTPVQFTTTISLPGNLSLATTYYVILESSTTIKVATTLANAVAGSAIAFSSTGSGVQTMTLQVPAAIAAEYIGEFTHAPTISEMALHNHPGSDFLYDNLGSQDIGANGTVKNSSNTTPYTVNVAAQGGGVPFNISQPTTFMWVQIKL